MDWVIMDWVLIVAILGILYLVISIIYGDDDNSENIDNPKRDHKQLSPDYYHFTDDYIMSVPVEYLINEDGTLIYSDYVNSDSISDHIMIVQKACSLGMFSAALKYLNKVMSTNIDDRLYYNKGMIYTVKGLLEYHMNRYKKSDDGVNTKLKNTDEYYGQNMAPIRSVFYLIYRYTNSYNKAVYASRMSIRSIIESSYHDEVFNEDICGYFEDAIKCFNKAIDMDSTHIYYNNYYAKAVIMLLHGKFEDAVENLDKAVDIDSTNSYVYYVRGFAKSILGKFEDAIEDFNKVIDISYTDSHAYYNLTYMRILLGQHTESTIDHDKAIKKWHVGWYHESVNKQFKEADKHSKDIKNKYHNKKLFEVSNSDYYDKSVSEIVHNFIWHWI